MIIAIDIGNTNIVIGVYHKTDLITHWRVSSDRGKTPDEYGMLFLSLFSYSNLDSGNIDGAIISSVVPPLTPIITETVSKFFHSEPVIVSHDNAGMKIVYDNPRDVGADRIVNAVAAFQNHGGPVIVVDFGTATTFDAVSKDGAYLGGAISPGIGISTEALFKKAAKLPRIEIVKPKSVIGTHTVHSMQAGIVFGFVGQVDFIVKKMKNELGKDAKAVATGGLAELISQETETIDVVDPLLTLRGLRIIFDRVRNRKEAGQQSC